MYKLVIPSAGIGSRIGPLTKFVNKALVTVGDKPAIARIIDSVPEQVKIVIPVGYKAYYLQQVLIAMYPNRHFEFVQVDNYEGPGSGLGYTLNCAKHLLQCPFIFIPNDTICKIDFQSLDPCLAGNWLFYYNKCVNDRVPISQYRTVQIHNQRMVDILPKGSTSELIYTGICGINDYTKFWTKLSNKKAVEIGESYALKTLKDVKAFETKDWIDIGNLKSLKKAKQLFNNGEINILEKENEAIWFTDDKVLKFHIDEKFISDRVERIKFLPDNFSPEILHQNKNIYVYKMVEGNIFSKVLNNNLTWNLLNKVQKELWLKGRQKKTIKHIQGLEKFYKNKSFERVNYYFERFESSDEKVIINGKQCAPILERLNEFKWDILYQGAIIANFHGDFHSENILINSKSELTLLDWRQNFGELGLEHGDVNYDLAKFLHGLLVSHDQIDNDNFFIKKLSKSEIRLDLHINFINQQSISVLEEFCKLNSYDYNLIKLLTSLIFLNICGLHEHPYSEFLFYFGRYLLEDHFNC